MRNVTQFLLAQAYDTCERYIFTIPDGWINHEQYADTFLSKYWNLAAVTEEQIGECYLVMHVDSLELRREHTDSRMIVSLQCDHTDLPRIMAARYPGWRIVKINP